MRKDVMAAAVALLAVAVYGGVLVFQPFDPEILVQFTDIGMLLGSGTAAACAVVAVRRHSSGQARRSWTLIALGLFC